MRLLHKLAGLEWLEFAYHEPDEEGEEEEEEEEDRNWFNGIKIYSSRREVMTRFVQGKPLSCFGTENGGTHLHVAYDEGLRFEVKYLTLEYNTSSMYVMETGVMFCQFRFIKTGPNVMVTATTKKALCEVMNHYALMLPFKKNSVPFQKQYTLVYHDWDVLVCDDTLQNKGFPVIDKELFNDQYIEQLGET